MNEAVILRAFDDEFWKWDKEQEIRTGIVIPWQDQEKSTPKKHDPGREILSDLRLHELCIGKIKLKFSNRQRGAMKRQNTIKFHRLVHPE